MGSADARFAAERLLRECVARCDGGGLHGFVRHIFWHDGWAGLCIGGCGGQLDADCAGPAWGAFGGSADAGMMRVVMPAHLRTLVSFQGEVELEVQGAVTVRSVLDALEARFPMLRGTIREHVTQERRPFLRFFACGEDLSHDSMDAALPDAVASGAEPLLIIGAIAGGSSRLAIRSTVHSTL